MYICTEINTLEDFESETEDLDSSVSVGEYLELFTESHTRRKGLLVFSVTSKEANYIVVPATPQLEN